jgi:ribosomal protein S18 acetylase RimI-like enzyme
MTDTSIRSARPDDLPEMQEVARRTIDKCYRPFLGDDGVDWFINSGESDRELEKHLLNCDVMLRDEKVVAFTIYFDDLIHLMMVDVDVHRAGLGSQLLAHSESRLFASGKTVIRLETFEGNQQAISFYLKTGWSITRKQEDEDHGFTRVFFSKRAQS